MTWMWPLVALTLFLFLYLSVASSLDLCPMTPIKTVTTSSKVTWAQVLDQPIRQLGPSYLRPDIGTYFCHPQQSHVNDVEDN